MTLIDRLKELKGPSREVDAEITRALAGSTTDHWYTFGEEHITDETCAPFTASLDATTALFQKMLPDCIWELQGGGDDSEGVATLNLRHSIVQETGATPAISLLIALLTALEHEGGRSNG